MDDTRFLALITEALGESELDPAAPASPADPDAVAAWARFLRLAVARGISLGDPRWARLHVRPDGKGLGLLPGDRRPRRGADRDDFQVGLSLLIGVLGKDEKPRDT